MKEMIGKKISYEQKEKWHVCGLESQCAVPELGVANSLAEEASPPRLASSSTLVRNGRLVRNIKEEQVDLADYQCYNNDAVFQLGRFLNDVDMHKRIHSSLDCLTPAEFKE